MVEDKNLSREGNSEDPGKKAAADAARKKPAGKPDESAAKPKKKKTVIRRKILLLSFWGYPINKFLNIYNKLTNNS